MSDEEEVLEPEKEPERQLPEAMIEAMEKRRKRNERAITKS